MIIHLLEPDKQMEASASYRYHQVGEPEYPDGNGTAHDVQGNEQGAQHPWKTHLRSSRLEIHRLTVLKTGGHFKKKCEPKDKPRKQRAE